MGVVFRRPKKADFQTKMVYSQTIEFFIYFFRAIIENKMGHMSHIIYHSIALEELDFSKQISNNL